MITSFVPAMPSSKRNVRSGELALKYGPSVNSGVTAADWLSPLHARMDVSLELLLPVVADGAVQADRMMQRAKVVLIIFFRFIFSPSIKKHNGV